MILVYRIFTFFFYPLFILLIYVRKLLKKEDKIRYKEKISSRYFFPTRNKNKKLIWFHAASIGEVQSIFPILEKFILQEKNIEFLITTVTLSSGNLVKKYIGDRKNINHRYFPLDVRFLIKKFLYAWHPNLIIFVDSEIWPNLIFEIKKNKISSAIINGRLTEKTFKRWMMVPKFAKQIFSIFDLCLVSSKKSKIYFEKLNVQNLKHFGNIKLAGEINLTNLNNINKDFLIERKFWCASSTHKGEEFFCLKTHLNLKKVYKNIITIIIPRHIKRSYEIKQLCKKLNLKSQILENNDLIKNDKEIIIINSFGVLPKYFKYSKSVFIGKSFLDKFKLIGGQNPIEAAKLGCKIYHGPHVSNFREIYELFKTYKISEEVSGIEQLTNKLIIDLKSPKIKQNNVSDVINNLGKDILNNSIKELNKINM